MNLPILSNIIPVGSISAAFSSPVYVSPGKSAGSLLEQRLVIEPIIPVDDEMTKYCMNLLFWNYKIEGPENENRESLTRQSYFIVRIPSQKISRTSCLGQSSS